MPDSEYIFTRPNLCWSFKLLDLFDYLIYILFQIKFLTFSFSLSYPFARITYLSKYHNPLIQAKIQGDILICFFFFFSCPTSKLQQTIWNQLVKYVQNLATYLHLCIDQANTISFLSHFHRLQQISPLISDLALYNPLFLHISLQSNNYKALIMLLLCLKLFKSISSNEISSSSLLCSYPLSSIHILLFLCRG